MAREVTARETDAERVAAAAEAHSQRIAVAFIERFGQYVPKKEEAPDLGVVMRTVAAALRASSADLVLKSATHDAELADDAAPREARDSAKAALIDRMVNFRSAVDTVYGRAGLKALGIDARTPTDARSVQEQARNLVAHLQNPRLKLPKPQEGVSLDKRVWAARLLESLPVLEQARKDVAREEREAEITGNAKSRSMAAFDDMFSVVATFTSSMLDLIGEDDLATRIKPSARRRGVTAESDAEDTGGEAEDSSTGNSEVPAGAAGTPEKP